MDGLPSKFDIIVIGTGMVESILSAAASRIGKKVLHIDDKSYYGGHWASFNLEAIQKLGSDEISINATVNAPIDQDGLLKIGNDMLNIQNFNFKWHIPPENVRNPIEEETLCEDKSEFPEKLTIQEITQETLLKEFRKFNIDLTPKLHFARGEFVDLLISSNIARYSEYRSVSRVLTWLNGQLEVVPCSRSDVFANTKVSVIEKRMLMKLLTSLDDSSEDLASYNSKTFLSYLKDKKLTNDLIHYVLFAISRSTAETSFLEGIKSTKRFLNSLGRFGKTPFLFALYGSGETPQAFCRLSAVFGGVYALSQPLNGLVCTEDKCKALVCDRQKIEAEQFVIGVDKCPSGLLNNVKMSFVSRAVLITDRSVMDSEKEHLTLLMYPPENGKPLVTIIELGTLTGTCPDGYYVVHLISKQHSNPEEDFQHVIDNLFSTKFKQDSFGDKEKPKIICSCYFSLPDTSESNLNTSLENVHICSGPDLDLDYDCAIQEARKIFSKIYPAEEFLPRAPDPEEIIIEGEEDSNQSEQQENSVVKELLEGIKNDSLDGILNKDTENTEAE